MNPIANHLWQSTVFAGVAGLLTLVLRKNHARVRHGVWLAASCKFLIPLSMLIALGGQFRWRTSAAVTQSSVAIVMDEVSQPFTVPSELAPITPQPKRNPFPMALSGVWLFGFIGISYAWWVRWRRIQAAVRAGSNVRMNLPIPVISSPATFEPGVFGVFRPVLLLPEGIVDRLTATQLSAVLEHELCHVRHRDNLTAAVQMFVETVFWFHPAVWWIGKRMVEERERACDEEVMRVFGQPRSYADAILSICRLYVESPLVCVSGVSGANLRGRIEAIMMNRNARGLGFAKKALLVAAVTAALATPILIGIVNAPSVRAQARTSAASGTTARQKFEVASIRLSKDCQGASGVAPPPPPPPGPRAGGGPVAPPKALLAGGGLPGQSSGRLTQCRTLEQFIRSAYVIFADGQPPRGNVYGNAVPIEGGPAWMRSESESYQITAKADGPASQPAMGVPMTQLLESQAMMSGPMMQALLEDRFKLKVHRETREGPVYALTVAPGGLKLPKLQEGICIPRTFPMPTLGPDQNVCEASQGRNGANATYYQQAIDLDTFATYLFVLTDRPVVNRTGLTGRFSIRLEYTPDDATPGGTRMLAVGNGGEPVAPDPAGGLSIFTAVQQQLGLKLEPAKGTRDYLVIDHVERPSEN